MLRATLKSIMAHKLRLALTALSIVLGVGFIAGTFIYTDTIGNAFDGIFEDAFEGVDILVSAESDLQFGEGVYLDQTEVEALADVEGVEGVFPYVQGFGVTILDQEDSPIGGAGPPQFGASFDETAAGAGGFVLRDGDYPMGSGQVVIDAASAESAEYAIGDTVTIVTPIQPATDYELVGIAGFGDLDNLGGATFALFDLPTIQTLIEREGELTSAAVQVTPGVDVDAVIERLQPRLAEGVTAVSGQTAAEQQAGDIQEGLAFFNTFLLTFGFIALFVGTFIIYNTFRIIVTQRTKELALFRAIGATASQVNRMVLIEALIIGVVASIVGIGVGFGIAVLLRSALEAFGIALPSASLQLAPRTIVVGMVVGVLVTMVSAVLPARRASRVPPIAALRDNVISGRRSLRGRTIAGVVVLGIGLAVLFTGLFATFDSGPPEIVYVGIGAAVVFIGVSVLAPLVAAPVSHVIGWPFRRLFKIPGKLATENAARAPRRTSATASALMIGITLVTLASVMAASIRGTISDILGDSVNADVFVLPENQFDPTSSFSPVLAERIAADPDIELVTRAQVGSALFNDTEFFITGTTEGFDTFFPYDELEGTLEVGPDQVFIDAAIAEAQGYALGDTLDLTFESTGTQQFEIVGIATGDVYSDLIVMSTDEWVENYGAETDSQLYVNFVEGVTPDEGKITVEALADDIPSINVQTIEEIQTDAENQINQLLNLITGLLGLAVIIALIGVTNTMTLSVFERTREIGLLRAVGLSRRQTRRMIRSEASIIAVFGAILGVAIGVFFGWAILRALADEGFSAFVIPFASVIGWILVTGLLGIVFALLPAWRASKLNILEAIGHE